MARFNLKVNGEARVVDADPDTPMLYVLRDNLALKGPSSAAGSRNAARAPSTLTARRCAPACCRSTRSEGAVTTLEGLGTSAKPSQLQQAFIDEQAAQCGYCINGMIMTSAALLAKNKSPSEAEIRDGARRQPLPLRHPSTHRRRCEARGGGLKGRRTMTTSAQGLHSTAAIS